MVPATRVTFNPATRELTIKSPKDVEITNLVATVNSNGTASITMGAYSSRNNVEVLAAVASQNAALLKAAAEIGGQVIGAAVKNAH